MAFGSVSNISRNYVNKENQLNHIAPTDTNFNVTDEKITQTVAVKSLENSLKEIMDAGKEIMDAGWRFALMGNLNSNSNNKNAIVSLEKYTETQGSTTKVYMAVTGTNASQVIYKIKLLYNKILHKDWANIDNWKSGNTNSYRFDKDFFYEREFQEINVINDVDEVDEMLKKGYVLTMKKKSASSLYLQKFKHASKPRILHGYESINLSRVIRT